MGIGEQYVQMVLTQKMPLLHADSLDLKDMSSILLLTLTWGKNVHTD